MPVPILSGLGQGRFDLGPLVPGEREHRTPSDGCLVQHCAEHDRSTIGMTDAAQRGDGCFATERVAVARRDTAEGSHDPHLSIGP